jgi:hypothetical protein
LERDHGTHDAHDPHSMHRKTSDEWVPFHLLHDNLQFTGQRSLFPCDKRAFYTGNGT